MMAFLFTCWALSVLYAIAAASYREWRFDQERREWREERRELLNRLQHPEIIPGEVKPPPRNRVWSDSREAALARQDPPPDLR